MMLKVTPRSTGVYLIGIGAYLGVGHYLLDVTPLAFLFGGVIFTLMFWIK